MRYMISFGFALSALFLASSTMGAALYVGPNDAYRTIQAGADAAKPGDTVIVRDGVYTDRTDMKSWYALVRVSHGGTEGHPITIRAEHSWREVGPGRGAVLDGQNNRTSGFVLTAGVSHITIRDFEIRNCRVITPDILSWAVAIMPMSKYPQTPNDHCSYLGNYIHDCDCGIEDYGNVSNTFIDGNVIAAVGAKKSNLQHGIYMGGTNTQITNNVIADVVGGWAIQVKGGDDIVPAAHNILISNNTIIRGEPRSQFVFNFTPTTQVVVQNNIFYQPSAKGCAAEFYNAKVDGITFRNNLLCGFDATYKTTSGNPPKNVTQSHTLTGDPMFVNPTGSAPDFHLKSGSPAIDAGIDAHAPHHDADGKTRPVGNGCDLGAYEAAGTSKGTGPAGSAAALPEGYGISARYPGDRGIGKDPALVFAEDFEVKDLDELRQHWSEIRTFGQGKPAFFLDTVVPAGGHGVKSLRITATRDENEGGQCYKGLPSGNERLFFRFYVKFADDYGFCHHFAGLGGEIVAPPCMSGNAGVRPVNSWCSFIDAKRDDGQEASDLRRRFLPPGVWAFYSYWPEMRSWENEDGTPRMTAAENAKQIAAGASGSYYGNVFGPQTPVVVERDKWTCVEIMVKMNSTPEKSDGEQALWIDGKLVGLFAPGSMTGRWSYATFRRDEQGRPFEGFRWRPDPRLSVNMVWLMHYVSNLTFARDDEAYAKEHPDFRINTRQATAWFDHVVVSREYVGPLCPSSAESSK